MPSCRSIGVILGADQVQQAQDEFKDVKNIHFIEGGKERIDSVYNGLNAFPDLNNEEIVLIHDAARPCITAEEVENLLHTLQTSRAATLAVPVNATLRKSGPDLTAAEAVSREGLWAVQTPQGFRYGDLLKAHEQADPQKNYTDDSALVSDSGIDVQLVQGRESNIKITYQQDFKMAEKLLAKNTVTLSGIGFDVHAFAPDKPGPVRLCGLEVPHISALKGHSDADVGLHALTDAILGAIGEGDIGQHFPPSNPGFKDMDSAIFLEKALEMMKEQNGQLGNIDLTLICEAPKIGPHAKTMRTRIAEITGLNEARINIKATTTEQLGFTGRKEGIAAQALVTIRMPENG